MAKSLVSRFDCRSASPASSTTTENTTARAEIFFLVLLIARQVTPSNRLSAEERASSHLSSTGNAPFSNGSCVTLTESSLSCCAAAGLLYASRAADATATSPIIRNAHTFSSPLKLMFKPPRNDHHLIHYGCSSDKSKDCASSLSTRAGLSAGR